MKLSSQEWSLDPQEILPIWESSWGLLSRDDRRAFLKDPILAEISKHKPDAVRRAVVQRRVLAEVKDLLELTVTSTRAKKPKPDLVDRAALVERLGVRATTVSRWYRRSILPPPDLRVGDDDVWLWATIHDWAGERGRTIPRRRLAVRAQTPMVVDLAEIANRLEVSSRTVASWLRRGLLPEPDYRWASTDAWLAETIDGWALAMAGRVSGLVRPSDVSLPTETGNISGPRLQLRQDNSDSPD